MHKTHTHTHTNNNNNNNNNNNHNNNNNNIYLKNCNFIILSIFNYLIALNKRIIRNGHVVQGSPRFEETDAE